MIAQLQAEFLIARKNKDTLKKTLLSVLIGEIQLQESRSGKTLDDKAILKVIAKLKKSCDDNAKLGVDGATDESIILAEYLPREMTKVDMIAILLMDQDLMTEIRESDNRNRLMGKAKKCLDLDGQAFNGKLLLEVLRDIK